MDSQVIVLRMVFSTPGRIRFHLAPEAKAIPDLDDILAIEGVKETSFNKLTKSLLIVYNHKIFSIKKLITALKQKIPKLRIIEKGRHGKKIERELPSHQLYKLGRKINKDLATKTKGRIDMFSLVLVLSLVWGVEELVRKPIMPKWYDILRFSQSLYTEIEIEEEV